MMLNTFIPLADIGSQITDVFNSGAAAGPIVLLSIAIIGLIVMFGIAIWKFAPIFEKLASKTPDELALLKTAVATNSQTANANASAIGGLSDNVSSSMASLSASQEKLGEHFVQATDVLSKINDGYNSQRTQIDASLGTVNAVKKITEETKGTVSEIHRHIMQGVEELTKISEVLTIIQKQNEEHPCLEKGDLDALAQRWESASAEILNAVRSINPEPYKLTAPSGVTAFVVETENKKEEV